MIGKHICKIGNYCLIMGKTVNVGQMKKEMVKNMGNQVIKKGNTRKSQNWKCRTNSNRKGQGRK